MAPRRVQALGLPSAPAGSPEPGNCPPHLIRLHLWAAPPQLSPPGPVAPRRPRRGTCAQLAGLLLRTGETMGLKGPGPWWSHDTRALPCGHCPVCLLLLTLPPGSQATPGSAPLIFPQRPRSITHAHPTHPPNGHASPEAGPAGGESQTPQAAPRVAPECGACPHIRLFCTPCPPTYHSHTLPLTVATARPSSAQPTPACFPGGASLTRSPQGPGSL